MIFRHTMSRRLRAVVLFFGVVITSLVLRISYAGSLTPVAAPAPTMHTLSEIYNPLASTSFDSSAITADSDGNALQITKCIISKQNGGNC
jgi:hypothetical protein